MEECIYSGGSTVYESSQWTYSVISLHSTRYQRHGYIKQHTFIYGPEMKALFTLHDTLILFTVIWLVFIVQGTIQPE